MGIAVERCVPVSVSLGIMHCKMTVFDTSVCLLRINTGQ